MHFSIRYSMWMLMLLAGACNQPADEPANPVIAPQATEVLGFEHPYKETEAIFLDLCDGKNGKGPVVQDTLVKYGKLNPFNFQRANKDKITKISFDFIQTCCLEFYGYHTFASDTIWLYYDAIPQEERSFCDCDCEYRMQYSLPSDSLDNGSVAVRYLN